MFRKMMGFNGQMPHCIIWWKLNGVEISKTVCYSAEEEEAAIKRFNTPGDHYNGYDNGMIDYGSHVAELGHLEAKGA